ncbi:hypothetical protein PHLGIDRAFT_125175 [Phlebiopsis gigantea 11061_1 CR5-6]|uniref:Clathrin/coatomer adaptor adaptin-like N-terminal domain-containing protein n=1 Tax=Phlebiopsis gigantea (strain 11061_1 CR5-6) TaxID=745531 RepID=A0A0C3PTX6_PHLG1|nr:hypothetical protein PHLGIDRAFT_125175 [Phlebiopsis gigantea 11061_1 CR5-6]
MAGLNLNTIAENATRLGARLQETISEHTRDLTIARGTGASYFDTPEDKVQNIRKQLDSNSDREKLDAMKRLIALISKGRNVSEFFAQVVKNVASHNLEIRKLVYIYLLRYAEHEPDLALLSINTFQKDLSDPNPLIRAMALRVLSGIKVPMIGSIVVLAIKKCVSDISPYVRKAAAMAVHQAYKLDSGLQPELIEIISNLLRDRSPLSIGSVATAFEAVCPTRLDILHKHYRRLCRTLIDVDEWGQADLMSLLLRYVRTMLSRPLVSEQGEEEVDPDVKLLLTSCQPLFQSYNPAVVLAVVKVFYYAGPPSEHTKVIPPMLRLLHTSTEVERTVLPSLLIVSQSLLHLLVPAYTYFLIRSDDIPQVKKDKMRLLSMVLDHDNYQTLLREFTHYAEDSDDELVKESIEAIGYCARLVPESAQQCLGILTSFIQSKHSIVVANAVIVLKLLVQSSLQQEGLSSNYSSTSIISRLAYSFDKISHPQARACILWLVGQYAASDVSQNGAQVGPEGVVPWAPDLLRKVALTFMQEEPIVRLQAVTLGAKLLVLSPSDRTLILLNRYVLSLARYDLNFDVRDRARMIGSLLSGVVSNLLEDDEEREDQGGVILRREQVKLVLLDGKLGPSPDTRIMANDNKSLGSLGAITGKDMIFDSVVPDWLEHGVESSLRDSEDDIPLVPTGVQSLQSPTPRSIASSSRPSPVVLTPTAPSPAGSFARPDKNAWTDLDKFYADANEESGEEESEDEEVDDDDEETEEEAERTESNEKPEESSEEEEESEEEFEEDHANRITRQDDSVHDT